MKATWEAVKNFIKSGLPSNTYSLWINPIEYVGDDGKTIILGCPNKFSRNWIEENYLDIILDRFRLLGVDDVALDLMVNTQQKGPSDRERIPGPEQMLLPNIQEKRQSRFIKLNTDFTFNRFVVGSCNEFAYSASRAISQQGNWNYHSLLMLANTGLGKSHLTQAIGNAVLEQDPESRVIYLTAEDFANDMIASLKNNCIEKFKNKYRKSCDVLLLEEVHFLSGKEKFQAELGFTLDALANDNKKVIFTSSLPPKDIPRISRELSSRLTSGLVTTIDGPDYETRLKILSRKTSENNIPLSEEIIDFLASRLTKDIRQMESALKCLKARSELLKIRIDLDLAKEVISCLSSAERAVTLEEIQKIVSTYYKIEPDMLKSKSRKKVFSYPRNIYAYLCRRFTHEPFEKIGRTINRSHSTIVYASELVERKMKSDDLLRRQVDLLVKKIDELKK